MINEREVQMLRRFLLLFGLLQATQLLAADISPVGDKPRWSTLERYQETMIRDDFTRLLQNVYATRGYDDLVQIGDDSARIVEDAAAQTSFTFRFAKETPRKLPAHYWRRIDKLGAASAEATAAWFECRARSGPPRRPLGQDGGAMVSGR